MKLMPLAYWGRQYHRITLATKFVEGVIISALRYLITTLPLLFLVWSYQNIFQLCNSSLLLLSKWNDFCKMSKDILVISPTKNEKESLVSKKRSAKITLYLLISQSFCFLSIFTLCVLTNETSQFILILNSRKFF